MERSPATNPIPRARRDDVRFAIKSGVRFQVSVVNTTRQHLTSSGLAAYETSIKSQSIKGKRNVLTADIWSLALRSAALLIFFAAAARARIVASDFVAADDLLHRALISRPAMRACSSSRLLRRWKASSMSSIEVVACRMRREPVPTAARALPSPSLGVTCCGTG